jgi:hypothetical protein
MCVLLLLFLLSLFSLLLFLLFNTFFISFFKSSIARALPSVEAAAQERISKAVQEGRGVSTKDLRLFM